MQLHIDLNPKERRWATSIEIVGGKRMTKSAADLTGAMMAAKGIVDGHRESGWKVQILHGGLIALLTPPRGTKQPVGLVYIEPLQRPLDGSEKWDNRRRPPDGVVIIAI